MTERRFSNGLLTLVKITLMLSILLPAMPVMTTLDPNPDQDLSWPMFNHDVNLTGYTMSTAPDTNETLWTYTTGGEFVLTQPAIKDGKLYILSCDGIFYCLNESTGVPIWTTDLTDAFGAPVTSRSTAAVVDGKVYGAIFDPTPGKVFCLNANTGNLIWEFTGISNFAASPVVIDGKLYITEYGGVAYCLNATTGAPIWSNTAPGSMIMSTPAIADGKMYFGTLWNSPNPNKVYCLDATTGAHIWNYTAEASMLHVLVVDGKLYADQSAVWGQPGRVYCLNATTSAHIWNFTTAGSNNSPLSVHGDRLFFGSYDKNMYCIDKNTGALIWSYMTGGAIAYSVPAISGDGKVLIGSTDGCLYCLNESTGQLIWKYQTEPVGWGGIYGSPAIADGIVFIVSTNKKIYALSRPLFPRGPEAKFTESKTSALVNEIIEFDASRSLSGYNGTHYIPIANYTWNFGDTNVITVPVPTISHAYTTSGTYTVNLTITCQDDPVLISLGLTQDSTIAIKTIVPLPVQRATPWFTMGQDFTRQGYTTDRAPSTAKLNWTYRFIGLGPIWGSPIVVGGKVYVAVGESGGLHCFDMSTGAQLWNKTFGSLWTTPTYANGKLYFGDRYGVFYCVNAETGEQIWNYSAGDSIYSSPAVAYGNVYFGSYTDRFYCLNTETGEEKWIFGPVGGDIYGEPAIADGVVYFGGKTVYKVWAINAFTGAEIWSKPVDAWVWSGVTVSQGKLLFGTCDGTKPTKSERIGTIYCLNAANGTTLWSIPNVVFVRASPSVHGDKVIFTELEGVVCVNIQDGSQNWYFEYFGKKGGYAKPAISGNGRVYVGDDDSIVYCLDEKTGSLMWHYNITEETGEADDIDAGPSISDGWLFVGGYDRPALYAFGPESAPPVVGTPWPMYQHDASHSGVSPGPSPLTNKILWTRYVGLASLTCVGGGSTGSPSGPAVFGLKVYMGMLDNKTYCLDEETGAVLWTFETNGPIYGTPAVADGKVYIGSTDSKLYCVDADNGTLIWSYATWGPVWGSPTVVGGRVYFGSFDSNVYCLDAVTGFKLWSYATDWVVFTTPAVVDGKVFFGSWDMNVYCLDAASGSSIWNFTTDGRVRASPTVADGKVYIATFYPGKTLYCLNAIDGSVMWRKGQEATMFSTPVVAAGKVYVTIFAYNYVRQFDAATGELGWTWAQETGYTSASAIESDIAYADGRIFFGSFDQHLYCLDAADGTQIWSYEAGGCVHSPSVADGLVFVGSDDGKIYAFGTLEDGVEPSIGVPSRDPLEPGEWVNVTVSVNVTDWESGVKNVTLSYTINNGTSWTNLPMNYNSTQRVYEATIPGQPYCTWVKYKIIAYDNAGNQATKDNAGQLYVYHVIPEFPTWALTFLMLLALAISVTLSRKRMRSLVKPSETNTKFKGGKK